MACPICGCEQFYVKNPDDAFDIVEFECKGGRICFEPDLDPADLPDMSCDPESYCDQCAWHGKLSEIQ